MDLKTNTLDVSSGISSVEDAVANLRLEFTSYLAKDISEAIDLINDLRSQLGDKDVRIEELEARILELESRLK